jgi:pimeloyl-ACP methyl ester carboxylesterase
MKDVLMSMVIAPTELGRRRALASLGAPVDWSWPRRSVEPATNLRPPRAKSVRTVQAPEASRAPALPTSASLEPELRFLILLAPLVDISHALFEGPTSWTIRRQLETAGLDRALVQRHAHLSSPAHAQPGDGAASRTLLVAGEFDSIVRPADLAAVRDAWPGAELISVPQAHFGYAMFPRAMRWLEDRRLLAV